MGSGDSYRLIYKYICREKCIHTRPIELYEAVDWKIAVHIGVKKGKGTDIYIFYRNRRTVLLKEHTKNYKCNSIIMYNITIFRYTDRKGYKYMQT